VYLHWKNLVEISLQKMKAKETPFFMMIEGSQIDWGGHANETDYIISEFQEFNLTIQKVLGLCKSRRQHTSYCYRRPRDWRICNYWRGFKTK
jgi:alkaline phosphatase